MQRNRQQRLFTAGFGWKAALCLVLLLLFVFVQVAHVHLSKTELDHCPLCILMQSASPLAAAATLILLVELGLRRQRVEHVRVRTGRALRHSIRPPPQGR